MNMNVQKKIFIYAILFIFFSCTKKSHEFKIEVIDNVEIAFNSETPLYSEKNNLIELKKILTIGEEEGDENYVLNKPFFMGVDSSCNIYILDFGDSKVLIYDKCGKYIHSFGRKGRGPGEFLTPFPGFISNNHNLSIIYDYNNLRFQLFTRTGELTNSFKLKERTFVNQVIIGQDGVINSLETNYEILKNKKDPLGHNIRLVRYTQNGKIISSFINKSLNTLEFRLSKWTGRACMSIDSEGNISVNSIDPNKYEINIYNVKGKLVKKIARKSKQFPYSKSEIERLKKSNKMRKELTGFDHTLPTMRPFINRFVLDDFDRLWIWTGEYDKEEGWQAIDIFNKEGRYLYKFITKGFYTTRIENKKLYQLDGFQVDYPRLVVYEIVDNLKKK